MFFQKLFTNISLEYDGGKLLTTQIVVFEAWVLLVALLLSSARLSGSMGLSFSSVQWV